MKNISLLLFFFFLINITSVVYSDNIINNSDHQYNQQLEFQEKLRLGNNSNVNLYDNIKVDRRDIHDVKVEWRQSHHIPTHYSILG